MALGEPQAVRSVRDVRGQGSPRYACDGADASAPKRECGEQSGGKPAPDQTIEDYFVSFVTTHQDSMTETELAEKLGISRKSLWERRQRLNIPRKKTKKRGRRRDVS